MFGNGGFGNTKFAMIMIFRSIVIISIIIL